MTVDGLCKLKANNKSWSGLAIGRISFSPVLITKRKTASLPSSRCSLALRTTCKFAARWSSQTLMRISLYFASSRARLSRSKRIQLRN